MWKISVQVLQLSKTLTSPKILWESALLRIGLLIYINTVLVFLQNKMIVIEGCFVFLL